MVRGRQQRGSADLLFQAKLNDITRIKTSEATNCFLNGLRDTLLRRESIRAAGRVSRLFQASDLPKSFWACAATLYQSATPRIVVVRATQPSALENICAAINQMMRHDRFDQFALHDWNRCRMQVDFIVDEPELVELSNLSDTALPDEWGGRGGRRS